MELSDILDAKAIQSMMDAFFALENIGMAIVDLRGTVLVATGWQDVCTKFHRVHPETRTHCAESDVALSAGVAPGEFKLYRCKNNLWDMATPIVVGGRHVGNFFLGQFFFDDERPDAELFRAQARRYGFDEAEYLAALDRVPRWSREKVARAMTFYARLATQISEMGYRNLQLAQALARQKRAEEDLRDSKQIIEGIIHAIPARVFWKDRNLTYLGCNEAFARDAGFASPKDVVGKDDFQMGWRDQAELYRADDRQVIESGTPKLLIEEPQTTPDGKTLALLTSKIPLRNAQGEIDGVLGTYLDVTDRKRAEKALHDSEEQYRLLVENAQEAIYVVRNGKVVFANAMFARLADLDMSDVIGTSTEEFVAPEDRAGIRNHHRRLVAGEKPEGPLEIRVRTRKGAERWMSINAAKILWQEQPATLNFATDITERKQDEKALRETEERFQQVAETSKEWIWEMDADGVYTYSNPIVEQILGYKPEELVGKVRFHELFAPSVREEIRKDAAGRAERKEAFRKRVNPVVHKDGHVVILETTGVPILDAEGQLAGYRGADTDVTERIRAEEALQESEIRYRTFINATTDLVFLKDEAFRYLISNRANSDFLGKSEEDVTGRTDFDLMPRKAAECCRASDQEALRQGTSVVSEETVDGRVHQTVKFPVSLPGGRVGVGGFIRDVTGSKQAEEALRKSEAQLSNAMEISHAGHWEYDVAGDTFTFNDNFYRIFRTTAEKAGGYKMSSAEYARRFCHPDDMALVRQETQAAIESTDPNYSRQLEHRILYADGTVGHIAVRFFIVKDAQGRTVKTYGVNQDITAHKEAEQALRDSEARYRSILNAAPDGIVIVSAEGRTHMVSPAAAKMFGFDPNDDLRGLPIDEFIAPEDQERAVSDMARTFEGLMKGPAEYRGHRRDGSPFPMETNTEAIRDAEGKPIQMVAVIRDITERKQAEEALRASRQITEGIIDAIPVRVFWKDRNLVFLGCNQAFARDAGFFDPQDLVGKDDFQMSWRPQAELYRADDRQVIESGQPRLLIEESRTASDGKTLTLLTSKIPLRNAQGEITGVLGTYMDVTERKQAEEKLRASEIRLREIAANVPGVVYQLKINRKGLFEVPFMSAGCERLFGQRLAGLDFAALWFDQMPPDDLAALRQSLAAAAQRMEQWTMEFRLAHPNGSIQWLRGSANPQKLPTGGILWNGVLLDITDLKRAEDQLQESQAFQSLMLETIPSPVFFKDRQGRYRGFNRAFEAFFGKSKDQLIGKTVFDISPPELAKVYYAEDAQLFEKPGVQIYESQVQDAQGVKHDVVFHKASTTDAQGRITGLIGVVHDITERKQAEEQMAAQLEELRRWYAATLDREKRVAELKREVNALAARLGEPPPYAAAVAKAAP